MKPLLASVLSLLVFAVTSLHAASDADVSIIRAEKVVIEEDTITIVAEAKTTVTLIQDDANPETISKLAVDILLQPERLLTLKTKIADVVRDTLGLPGGVGRAADLLIETATGKKPGPVSEPAN